MMVKTQKQVVKVYCHGGLNFTGEMIDISQPLFSTAKWFKLSTKRGSIILNSAYIVSIVYGHNSIHKRGGTTE